jgi:hypothetical protein
MPTTSHVLSTIGHSTHALSHVLDLLLHHGIAPIGDVRSPPYSRRNPPCNRAPLRQGLARHPLASVFLGEELGARSSDASYDKGGKSNTPASQRPARFVAGWRGSSTASNATGSH